MSLTLSTLRTGVAAALDTVTDLQVYEVYPGTVNPPCAVVEVSNIDFTRAGTCVNSAVEFTVVVLVGAVDADASWSLLDAYASTTGPASVYAALVADHTFGGACSGSRITGIENVGQYQPPGAPAYLGFTIKFTAHA